MGFFKSKRGSIISEYFVSKQDLGQLKDGLSTEISMFEDHLELCPLMSKQPISLLYDQITDVYYGFEEEIKEKNKSVIGRAVAGGLLFGGVGAIVGAASGTGKKQQKEIKRVFVISYTSSSGEDHFLQFEDSRAFKGQKLANKLKELCNIKDEVTTSL